MSYSYRELITEKLSELDKDIEMNQMILDQLRLTMPLTLDYTQIWINTKDAIQGMKGYRRQLRDMIKFLDEASDS